ncbi:MAG TPA: type II toxin-antitoxin system prevent-host-death family antitoxin [Candidatus Paceibacterota bacterium]|nr:type II toxin-antitoxin system prevent-host-death family antitoxin [Candidatus Paceibacterota bacterium]
MIATATVRELVFDYIGLIARVQRGERIVITRLRAPAIALVSVGDLDRLTELDAQKDNRADVDEREGHHETD